MKESKCKWVRLGDYIEMRHENNSSLKYGAELIEGVNNNGEFQQTKAITDDINLKPYKVVRHGDMVYNPSRLNIGSLAYRIGEMCIVSHLYQVFYVKEEYKNILSSEFLTLYLRRNEFYRYVDYDNFGSQRAEYNLKKLGELHIPLPPIEEQQKVVNAWKALREIKEQNEAIAAPLMQVCQSYIQELKHKYESVEIGSYIEEVTRTNVDDAYGEVDVRGVSNDKTMREYKGSLAGRNFKKFLLIKPDEFVFNKRTNAGMGLCLVKDRPYIFTEDYEAFTISDKKKLLPDFLYLFFVRPDFDRYILFNSWGSSVIFFHIADMKHVKIPLPPIDVQQSIVNLYNCANEAKKIAEEADKKSREICPALIQYVINK